MIALAKEIGKLLPTAGMFAAEKKLVSWHMFVAILASGQAPCSARSIAGTYGYQFVPCLQPLLQSYYQA
jgi:hypothetical protein